MVWCHAHRRQNHMNQKPGPTHRTVKTLEAIFTDATTITVHKNSLAIKFFSENLSFNYKGIFLLIIREHSISVSPQPPISSLVNLTFPHSKIKNLAQFSLPKVQPATEQSIMMDVFRGVASIAFCL